MANIHHMNSIEFPQGHLSGVKPFLKNAKLGTLDVVLTNPPFGADIPITDKHILDQFEMAKKWEKTDNGGFRNTGESHGSVAPEVLFVERSIKWVKPGGRIGIVLPSGMLGNPGPAMAALRWWIMKNCWVIAAVDLPVECFIVEANVNINTTLLFLKKKTETEIAVEDLRGEVSYEVFMAVSENTGFDRRGNVLYKKHPDGEDVVEVVEEVERIRVGKKLVERTLWRNKKVINNDLPDILDKFKCFKESGRGAEAHQQYTFCEPNNS